MAAPGTASIYISLDPAAAEGGTDELLTAMLRANPRVSDLIFSPGRKLQVQVNGDFVGVEVEGVPALTADDTRGIASHLIGNNKSAITMLREQGYCDISYALPGVARFRVRSCRNSRRTGVGGWPARVRKVFNFGRARGSHQCIERVPHYYYRRPDRVSAQSQTGNCPSARTSQ